MFVLFLAVGGALHTKKCAKLQKFFETRKKNFHFARRKGLKVPLGCKIIGIQSRINGRNRMTSGKGKKGKIINISKIFIF
jgi:hypothetical protein